MSYHYPMWVGKVPLHMYQTRVLRFFLLLILLASALALDPLVRPVEAGGVVPN